MYYLGKNNIFNFTEESTQLLLSHFVRIYFFQSKFYNLILFKALFLNKFASLIYLLTISVDL